MRKYFAYSLSVLALIVSLASCKSESKNVEPLSAEQLYDRYKKSVTLVFNSYYYEYKINDTLSLYAGSLNGYFTELYTSKEEAIANSTKNFGTAFFIDQEGTLATNLHVVAPEISQDQKSIFESAYEMYRENLNEIIQDHESTIAALAEQIAEAGGEDATISNLRTELLNFKQTNAQSKNIGKFVNQKIDFRKLKLVNHFVGIAYEQEQIATPENIEEDPKAVEKFQAQFHECNVVKKSAKGEIDIAIIQLKDRKTPSFVTNPLNFDDNNANTAQTPDSFDIYNAVKINKQVFMIGYNHGLELAKTAIGIKPQITSGNISQESDGIKVMYTIASLQGSSGSPIIDEWGNLIAVNFAGITNTQSFNYGILSYHLKDLVNGTNNASKFIKDNSVFDKKKNNTAVDTAVAADEVATEVVSEDDPNYDIQTYAIKAFLEAENNRMVDNVLSFYSNPVKQYWESYNISHEQLKKKYEIGWTITKWGKNSIKNIAWYSKDTYIVELQYDFETNDGTEKSVNSKLFIQFNSQNKIQVVKSM